VIVLSFTPSILLLTPSSCNVIQCNFLNPAGFAGNAFCGNVPRTLVGVVRSVVGVRDGQQLQLNVTHFLKPCPNNMMGSNGISEYAVVTGKPCTCHVCVQDAMSPLFYLFWGCNFIHMNSTGIVLIW